jgi:hypothetical protein
MGDSIIYLGCESPLFDAQLRLACLPFRGYLNQAISTLDTPGVGREHQGAEANGGSDYSENHPRIHWRTVGREPQRLGDELPQVLERVRGLLYAIDRVF